MKKTLFVIFLAAFLIRLISINQSLWLDETTTARVVKEYPLSQIISEFLPRDFHPPLYYLFMKVWTFIFEFSEASLRFPSLLFSLLTGYIVYKTAKKITHEKTAIFATVLFLFNPLIIYYSQEARMYMMAGFFVSCMVYFFLDLWKYREGKDEYEQRLMHVRGHHKSILVSLFFFTLASILAFYTFYGTIFIIVPMHLLLLYKKHYFFFTFSTFFFVTFFFIIASLLYQQLLNAKESLNVVVNWSLVLGKANIKNLLLIPVKFSIGRISFTPKLVYYALSAAWTLFVGWLLYRGSKKHLLLTILFLVPILSGFIVSFFTPLLQYFRFLYLLPLFTLLLAFGVRKNIQFEILALGFFLLSIAYLLNPSFHREDWKSLVNRINPEIPLYMVYTSSDPLRYYSPSVKVNDLADLKETESKFDEVNVIPYTSEIHGIDYMKILESSGFSQRNVLSFSGGLTLETWVRD